MKKILVICLLGLAIFGYLGKNVETTQIVQNVYAGYTAGSDSALQNAIDNKQSNLQIGGSGYVVKILFDDLKGSRHQRFILKIASGNTLLVAHNIDLAPRIENLNVGDTVEFYGVYEFNNKGGVIHWTHHDPRGQHPGGWLKHNGSVYQ
ncbi:DUF3465 domain-containing protein [Shewanella frigidimarina]|uniref:DUF3465 domain-containing protein n=1 Tax=Shewanella frigidimarina TaxID=56812 RepID=UPI000F508F99|nr:DUF3465 domain-containing protein [Shewanella frigidimarina]RPA63143.1 DUF3465 domain-containing protein [Shewanella frigidimarina]